MALHFCNDLILSTFQGNVLRGQEAETHDFIVTQAESQRHHPDQTLDDDHDIGKPHHCLPWNDCKSGCKKRIVEKHLDTHNCPETSICQISQDSRHQRQFWASQSICFSVSDQLDHEAKGSSYCSFKWSTASRSFFRVCFRFRAGMHFMNIVARQIGTQSIAKK